MPYYIKDTQLIGGRGFRKYGPYSTVGEAQSVIDGMVGGHISASIVFLHN